MSRIQLARDLARETRMGEQEATAFVAFVTSKTAYMNEFLAQAGAPMAAEGPMMALLLVAWLAGTNYEIRRRESQ